MENNQGNFKAGIMLAAGLVLAASILSRPLMELAQKDHEVVVTGSARKRIQSDLIVLRIHITSDATQLTQAYDGLSRDLPKVRDYLIKKGIPEGSIVVSAVSTITRRKEQQYQGKGSGGIDGYSLRQTLEIRSKDVEKTAKVGREVTELIKQGIMLESDLPEYIYTKLADLKIQMLAEASKDAKLRAEQIASSTGNSIGPLRAAHMGVMQINAADSNDVSGSGVSDTSSYEKDITAVVNITFAVK